MNSIVIGIIGFILGTVISILIKSIYDKKRKKDVKRQSQEIIDSAKKEAESIKKEAKLHAKSELYEWRNKFEKEKEEKSKQLTKFEQRLMEKEEKLDKRRDILEKREDKVYKKEKELNNWEDKLEKEEKEIKTIKKRQLDELSNITNMNYEEAKQEFLDKVSEDARDEANILAKKIKDEAKENAEKEANNIIIEAIQRTAVDTVSDNTTSVVNLPSDSMKGRVIGREGRNIRTLQKVTGVDFIIDDTPEAVTLSCFDPIRREIARRALEKLIVDGRIHPGRIEKVVEKTKKDIDKQFKEDGKEVIMDLNISHVHPKLVKLLGRLKFRTSYGQNVLQHSIESAIIMSIMAGELKLNVQLAKRIGLLHDIGKAVDFEREGTHAAIGAELAKKYGENDTVVNAIDAHHSEAECNSPYAVLIIASDAISAARPGARRESLESYIKRLENLERIASKPDGVEKAYAIQAGREIRIIVEPDQIDDAKAAQLSHNLSTKIEKELDYPGKIKINVIREKRHIEYAK
ncbi:MAG: ribonuclease Y [Candidatus Mcinerneyibacterium aminivorans]|jgi:ribonuclease Y|uniref:Ribonuclease Y n=1 Tax=Candidatus Mcinerneyibacterium aminivorans TaxID=2703815 RepID=A0A5D0MKS8_9BACT|nr:MAG: ribonuclease Y [Candidatus Mcinerneyibacterium aminivorans]